MTTHKPNLGEEKTGVFNEAPVFRNGIAKIPETRSAQENNGALLSASLDVGYAAVSAATHLDKSWVSRFFQDQSRLSRPELLHWLDAANLRLVHRSAESQADRDLLMALLQKTSAVLARESQVEHADTVTIGAEEYKSLLHFAQLGIKSRMEKL